MSPPNQLTLLRIILTPAFALLLISDSPINKQIALVVYCLAALTDWYDGWVARRWGYITHWGKFLDPLADKVLTSAAFISFIFFILATIASLAFFSGAISVNNSVWLANLTDAMLEFSEAIIFIFIFYTSINISYFTYFHGATGRTPGKMLLGLQVVNADGTTISFGTAFLLGKI